MAARAGTAPGRNTTERAHATGPAATTARRAKASVPRAPPDPMPQPRARKPRTTAATCGATDSGTTRAPTTATNPRAPAMTHLPHWVEPAPTPAPGGPRPQALITERPRREATHPRCRGSTRVHRRHACGEERTDCREAPAADKPRRVASRRFRLRHPQGRSEAEDPGGRSPEGLREAKGAIRLRGLRTEDVRDWTRARGPVAGACGSYRAPC